MPNEVKTIPEFTQDEPQSQEVETPETPPASTEVKPEVKEESEVQENREEQGLENELSNLQSQNAKSTELRQQIVEERRKRRQLRKEEPQEPETPVDDLSDIDEDSRKTIERVIKSEGYVRGDEVQKIAYETAHAQAEQSFYLTHPEYAEDKADDNDTLYNALQDELKNFATPKDASGIPVLFEKAHLLVKQRYASRFEEGEPVTPPSNKAKKDIASLGGQPGAAPTKTAPKAKLTSEQVESFRGQGWSEEDIEKLNI